MNMTTGLYGPIPYTLTFSPVSTQILRAFYSTRKQHPRDSKWLAPKRLHYNYVDSVVWSPPMRRRNQGKVITILAENQYRNCENTAKERKSVQLNFILQLWAIAFSQVRSIEELEVYLVVRYRLPGSTYTMLLPGGTPGDDPVKSFRPRVQSVPSQENML